MSLTDGGVIGGSNHSIGLSTGMINRTSERVNKMLTAVLPSQTSRDAADTVRFLLECMLRNLNGVKMCGVASLCSRATCVEGGMATGSCALPLNLDCGPARVEVEVAGSVAEFHSFGAEVDVTPRGTDVVVEATTEASG